MVTFLVVVALRVVTDVTGRGVVLVAGRSIWTSGVGLVEGDKVVLDNVVLALVVGLS